jgi:4-diphosphocytidyl-2-C-methyl-D-erythritol kinase
MGAGLGGGSSNAVAALRALNQLAGGPLGDEALAGLAAQLGSDCALFLHEGQVAMRGRGEIVEALGPLARLRGRKVLIFKPGFGIATAEAYAALARAGHYLPAGEAEARLAGWLGNPQAAAAELLFNSFERVAFAKYLALPTLLDELRRRFDLSPLMTGSGSACFAFAGAGTAGFDEGVAAAIQEAWGPSALVVETEIA